jgi:hypothetical protein
MKTTIIKQRKGRMLFETPLWWVFSGRDLLGRFWTKKDAINYQNRILKPQKEIPIFVNDRSL